MSERTELCGQHCDTVDCTHCTVCHDQALARLLSSEDVGQPDPIHADA